MTISTDPNKTVWDYTLPPATGSGLAIKTDITKIADPRDNPALAALLQCDPDGMRTYLVVDPTLRKAVTGLFDLDVLDIPARSLFDGKAAQENEEVAPYLIDVTVEAEDRIPRFNRDFIDRHWGRNTALVLRSVAPFDMVRKHFRKFTKLRREGDDRWFFFRFWDPRIASVYFRIVQNSPERAEQWFGRGLIDSYIVEEEDGRQAAIFRPGTAFQPSNAPIRSVILTDWEMQPFGNAAYERDIENMAKALKTDFDAELTSYSPEVIVSLIRPTLARFGKYGFRRKENLHVIAAWGLFFGPDFVEKDPEGVLEQICQRQEPEAQRFAALKKRMAQFGTSGKDQ